MPLFLEVSCLWEIMTDFAWCRNREVSLCVKRFSPFLCENNLENSLLGVVLSSIVNTFFVWNIYNIKEKKTLQFCLALKIQEISKNLLQKKKKLSMSILPYTGWYGIIIVVEYISWFRKGCVENIVLSLLLRLDILICQDHMPSVAGRGVSHCYLACDHAFDGGCNQVDDRLACDSIGSLWLGCR